ncbi:MAG: hypothetical protein IJ779_08520 [Ruminococcus sp.]|nr:hypothetical protein [Ruminococcus sp.]
MKYRTIKRETGFILLAVSAAVGIAFGAVWAAKGQLTESPWLHQYFIPTVRGESLFVSFLHTALSALIFLLAVFLVGTSAAGQPTALALMAYRGFGAGFSAAVVYDTLGLKAVPAVLVHILPKAAGMLIIAVFAVREALRCSCGLACFFAKGESGDGASLGLYAVRFIVLAVISILLSAADTALNSLFGSLLR